VPLIKKSPIRLAVIKANPRGMLKITRIKKMRIPINPTMIGDT